MKKVINLRDAQIEKMGQEFGDSFVLMAKSHFASMDALKDIVSLNLDSKVNERILQLTKELELIELMYKPNGPNS